MFFLTQNKQKIKKLKKIKSKKKWNLLFVETFICEKYKVNKKMNWKKIQENIFNLICVTCCTVITNC